MGPYVVLVSAFLAIAVAMAIVVYFPICCKLARYEGFQSDSAESGAKTSSIHMKCPKGTRTYTDSLGNTNCCEGVVSGTLCEGTIKCTLSSQTDKDVPTCADLRKQYLQEMDKQCIFKDMPKYFETDTRRGCAANVTESGDGPSPSTADTCTLYGTDADKYQRDSCRNRQNRQGTLLLQSVIRPNFCMDVLGWNKQNGAQIGMWDCYNGENQMFKYNPQTGSLQNVYTGKCLDGTNPDNKNGVRVVQQECNGSVQQSWFPDGAQRIRNRQNPQKCLDIFAGKKENGAGLVTWDCNPFDNQKFKGVKPA